MFGDRTAPVDRFAFRVAEHVHGAVFGHGLQNPVRGGEGDRNAAVLQDPVQLLGADEIIQFVQSRADRQPLFGDPLLFHRCACFGHICLLLSELPPA